MTVVQLLKFVSSKVLLIVHVSIFFNNGRRSAVLIHIITEQQITHPLSVENIHDIITKLWRNQNDLPILNSNYESLLYELQRPSSFRYGGKKSLKTFKPYCWRQCSSFFWLSICFYFSRSLNQRFCGTERGKHQRKTQKNRERERWKTGGEKGLSGEKKVPKNITRCTRLLQPLTLTAMNLTTHSLHVSLPHSNHWAGVFIVYKLWSRTGEERRKTIWWWMKPNANNKESSLSLRPIFSLDSSHEDDVYLFTWT